MCNCLLMQVQGCMCIKLEHNTDDVTSFSFKAQCKDILNKLKVKSKYNNNLLSFYFFLFHENTNGLFCFFELAFGVNIGETKLDEFGVFVISRLR